ncbi:MAG TPA: penicillin acylase family protein, partial [Bacteroidetes bacterium]|nr:penicillin acylase family protein [Bacteroidota bacterium]
NIVYADVEGNIGYWVTGKTPIRSKGTGAFPQKAWTGEYDWVGSVPFEEMPHTLNPKRGYVVSANHKIVDDDFPYFMGDNWMNGYRARRIEEMLAAKKSWKLADFFAIQMDVKCIPGLEFASHYKKVTAPENAKVALAWKALCDWDGELGLESVGGTIYQVCKHEMVYLLYEVAAKGAAGLKWLMGMGLNPVFAKVTEFHGKETVALLEMLEKGDSPLLELAGGKEKVMQMSMLAAVRYLQNALGQNQEDWHWGRLHKVEFQHSMAAKAPMDYVFNVGPFPIAGDTDTVCQTSIHPNSAYLADLALPSYRQIIDLADFNRSKWVMPPGQSGQLGHPNYDGQVDAWIKGRYFPMLWNRKDIENAAKIIAHLQPF